MPYLVALLLFFLLLYELLSAKGAIVIAYLGGGFIATGFLFGFPAALVYHYHVLKKALEVDYHLLWQKQWWVDPGKLTAVLPDFDHKAHDKELKIAIYGWCVAMGGCGLLFLSTLKLISF